MSTFEVKVVKIDAIEPIPGADAIELAKIADYRSVVRKGDYKAGDLAVYIPEASVVPEWLLKKMNLEGKLAGSNKNRVKAIKLRGCLSQGILYKLHFENEFYFLEMEDFNGYQILKPVSLGRDVAEILEIKKYEPPIPTHMAGEVLNLGTEHTLNYDIENLKKYPHIFIDGEEVVATEKLHGTFCCIGYIPGLGNPELFCDGDAFVSSKGLGSKGLVFKNNEQNKNNLYVKELIDLTEGVGFNIIDALKRFQEHFDLPKKPVYILGEIFGKGVQDLTYGQTGTNFRVFDIYVGKPGQGKYLNHEEFVITCSEILDLAMVPILYKGPYSRAKLDEVAQGPTTFGNSHMREGIVIKPTIERKHDEIGRVFLKHINTDYLIRKNSDATEYQ